MKEMRRDQGRRAPNCTDGRALSQLGQGGAPPKRTRTLEAILEEAETAEEEGEEKETGETGDPRPGTFDHEGRPREILNLSKERQD